MSTLARFAAVGRAPDPAEARRLAKQAWHRDGIILINPDWLNSWADRKQAEILAEKAHGKRRS